MARFDDRIALVTGGTAGIGLGVARRLLDEGARVALCGSDPQRLAAALKALDAPERTVGVAADLADPAAIDRLFAAMRARWGDADILVNNAGVSPKRRTAEPWTLQIDAAEWRRVLDVNLTAAWHCARLACPAMIARRRGRIVNIGSIAGRTAPKIAGPHYAAAKAGLIGLTRALAFDLAPHGITANCIAPAWIVSGMTAPADSPAAREAAAGIPVGRVGQPADVAAAVAFLAGDEAAYVNGVVLDLNGGAFMA